MVARVRIAVLVASLALALLAVPGGSAQIHNCGDIQIVFKNPDLQPAADDFIHASGQFFAQFQAIGEAADQITTFGFSFGAYTAEFDEAVCDLPPQLWFTGQQIPNYRADTDPSDGFFINLQTPLVPDGTYTAAVHAYDEGNNELARFWARAIVDNCDGDLGARCDGDAAQNQRQDKTAPWPIMLPGDGQKMANVTGFSLEFAEELSNLTVYLNNEDITASLEPWAGRVWDDDLLPGYGPYGLGAILVPECSQQPPQTCGPLGVAYTWNGRELTDADLLRVEAADLAGNLAVKAIHIGSSVASGAITEAVPILRYTVDNVEQTIGTAGTAVFDFKVQNDGGGTGHPFAAAEGPEGWTLEWQPVHVVVEPGATEPQSLLVTAPRGAFPGSYAVNATLEYQAGGETKLLTQPLTVVLQAGEGPAPTTPAASGTVPVQGQEDSGKGSPGAGLAVLVIALASAAAILRRR